MATVAEVNETFAEKGIYIKLPLPDSWLVKQIEVLEKKRGPAGSIGVLLAVKFFDDSGREVSDLFFCEGRVKLSGQRKAEAPRIREPLKSVLLPLREDVAFEDEEDAKTYLRDAISHLLRDKGYRPGEESGVDLYFEKGPQGFFINLASRCDERGLEKAKELLELRRRHGSTHEYGLVVPAFQESLGILLRDQESWIFENQEYLSAHRIGVYAVDNQDPNRLYAFTIFPKPIELLKYFMATTPQWSLVRARFVESRGKN